MDTQIVQDLLPGTGSMGSVPMHHDYKRAVIKTAPKEFTVEVLPPKKFGSGYCYGMHISPINGEGSDARSLKSARTSSSINTEYEIWRRWEDCLWFQDLLETEYKLMARTKRTRLAQGKGIKKEGVYIHSDQAASFDSFPPGPDVNDIAKDVHVILPKLTKKGTLFRAGQATIEQRGREFAALIHALYQDEVPTLIKELRANRIIRDFFGYWRRDKDHDRKMNEGNTASNRMSRTSITSSAFSMYFSSSSVSLSLPGGPGYIPPTPPIPEPVKEIPWKGKKVMKAASFTSTSSSSSRSSGSSSASSRTPRTPVSAPAGMSFTVNAAGNLIPTSHAHDDEPYGQHAGPSSAPLKPSSSQWSFGSSKPTASEMPSSEKHEDTIVFVPDSPWAESFDLGRSGGLQPLPEEQELVPTMSELTIRPSHPLPPRRRNYSCPDPGNRNGLIFMTPPQGPLTLDQDASSVSDAEPVSPIDIDSLPVTPLTHTDSSRHSSVALTEFCGDASRRSSWRTSIGSIPDFPDIPGDIDFDVDADIRDSGIQFDPYLCSAPVSRDSPLLKDDPTFRPSHWPRSSVATMNSVVSNSSVDAVLPRRSVSPVPKIDLRRSLSAGSRRSVVAPPALSVPVEESWDEQQDDVVDAYFYDPCLRPPPTPPLSGQITPGRERTSTYFVSTPDRFPKPFQHRPPGQFHLPWAAPAKSASPRMSVASFSTSAGGPDTFTVKAVRHDSIVLLRASYTMSLPDIRAKIRDKFASQDGRPLTDAYTIGFAPVPSASQTDGSARGRPRSQSTSALRQGEQPRLRFICTEDDWQTALSTCTGKLTLHVFDRF